MQVEAGYGWLPDGSEGAIAVVEMATASGLVLLDHELDPLRATTFGTGQLLEAAVSRGARRVWLAVGGSATVDGGVGAAMALGWRFLDAAGQDVGLGGARLERIVRIQPPTTPTSDGPESAEETSSLPPVTVLCDVENTLLGTAGAARVFGPQKGATPEVVDRLERGLANLADAIERDLGVDVRALRGGGAAGGLTAGAAAFLDAELESGVEVVAEAIELDESLEGSAWVVTGEGRFDAQSLHGKVVSGVVRRAARQDVRVAVIAGRDELGAREAARHGVSAVESCVSGDSSELEEAESMGRAPELLRSAAGRFASRHLA
jgi:glycerate kinase